MDFDLIHVVVILHSVFKDLLPKESNGQVGLDLPQGSSIRDLAKHLQLHREFNVAINRQLERDLTRRLQDGDEIRFFRPGAGG